MSLPLARKYRPKDFSELFGNKEEVKSLEKTVEQKKVTTFLLYGERGCGKTTCAKIMAEKLGAGAMGISELNISNTTGVDAARQIIEESGYMARDMGSKVVILNEVQMASKNWMNAMLEILEQPPSNTYFILCTTNPEKLIKPVKSRCSQFKFSPLSPVVSQQLIKSILTKEDQELSKEVIRNIAKKTEGIPREIITLLEKVLSVEEEEQQLRILQDYQGVSETEDIRNLCKALLKGSTWKTVSGILKSIKEEPESVRYAVLGYMNVVLLNSGKKEAAEIIAGFSESFIQSGRAGLTLACFEIVY